MPKKRLKGLNIVHTRLEPEPAHASVVPSSVILDMPSGSTTTENVVHNDLNAVDNTGQCTTRGRTTLKELWELLPDEHIVVSKNTDNQLSQRALDPGDRANEACST